MSTEKKHIPGVLSGAAFLMAVSAIGPGFLTQTTQFTAQLGASLAFAILVSIVIDIGAQLNTWRVICISGKRGNEVANAVVPGLGVAVTGIILFGSWVFNLGNFSGCALGFEALFGLPHFAGASLSALVAIGLFVLPRVLAGMDWFSRILGVGMIAMTFYILVVTAPPIGEAARQAVWPDHLDANFMAAIVTLVGGTIGGYIMFSGAHRLLDGGIQGAENAALITRASIQGIIITGIMRTVLFLAILGVVVSIFPLSPEENKEWEKGPVFYAFRYGAGEIGFVLSGLVFWSAAITSVVGCSYTAISFMNLTDKPRLRSWLIIGFIAVSLAGTLVVQATGWQPTELLIAAGTLNGVLLPIILGVILIAAYRPSLMGTYHHPWWAGVFGLLAWIISVFFAYQTVQNLIKTLG